MYLYIKDLTAFKCHFNRTLYNSCTTTKYLSLRFEETWAHCLTKAISP